MKRTGVLTIIILLLVVGTTFADHVTSITLLAVDECPKYPFEALENTNTNPYPTLDVTTIPEELKSVTPWYEAKILDTGGVNEECWVTEVNYVSDCEIAWKQFGLFDGQYCIYLGKTSKQTKKILLDMSRIPGEHTYKIGRKLNQATEFFFDGELVYSVPQSQLIRTSFVLGHMGYWSNPVGVAPNTILFRDINDGWDYEKIVVEYTTNGFLKLKGVPRIKPMIHLVAEYGTPQSPQTKSWYLIGNFSPTGESCHYIADLPPDTNKLTAKTIGLASFDSAW